MGTNYYLHENVCDHCGRSDEKMHIGKSSGGWCFSLRVYPDIGIFDWSDWLEALRKPGAIIKNEYWEVVTLEQMVSIVTDRANSQPMTDERARLHGRYSSAADFHAKNHSEMGPNNLLRHRRSDFCVGHGAGTWDLMSGEFS
jgi:hypothetical protein